MRSWLPLAVTAMAATPTGAFASAPARPPVEIRIGQPVVVDDVTGAEGDTGLTAFSFPISVFNPLPEQVAFTFFTVDGTARADDADYVPTVEEVLVPSGQTYTSVTVQVRGDTRVEPDESFTLELLLEDPALAAGAAGVGTIQSDDVPTPVLVSGFTATRTARGVELGWRPGAALALEVQRADDGTEAWRPVRVARHAGARGIEALDTEVDPRRAYRYRLATFGGSVLAGPIRVAALDAAAGFALAVAPNPARGPLRASVHVPADARVRLDVVDLASRVVAVVFEGGLEPGTHEIVAPAPVRRLPAGLYVWRLQAPGVAIHSKVVVTR